MIDSSIVLLLRFLSLLLLLFIVNIRGSWFLDMTAIMQLSPIYSNDYLNRKRDMNDLFINRLVDGICMCCCSWYVSIFHLLLLK